MCGSIFTRIALATLVVVICLVAAYTHSQVRHDLMLSAMWHQLYPEQIQRLTIEANRGNAESAQMLAEHFLQNKEHLKWALRYADLSNAEERVKTLKLLVESEGCASFTSPMVLTEVTKWDTEPSGAIVSEAYRSAVAACRVSNAAAKW